MKRYSIEISEQARWDLLDLNDTIINKYKAPSTAVKYMRGLAKEIKKLESTAESFAIQSRNSLSHFGFNVRRINYKRMTVIYTVHNDTVHIHRIVASNMISGL